MQCFRCLEYMSKGQVGELEKMKSECMLYKNQQCDHLARTGTFHGRLQTAAIKLFPEKVSDLLKRGGAGMLPVLVGLIFILYIFVSSIDTDPTEIYTHAESNMTAELNVISLAKEAKASGDLPEAFILLSTDYVYDFGKYTQQELYTIRQSLINLGQGAIRAKPSELYSVYNISEDTPLAIYRVRGFVTDIESDRYSGVRIVLSDTTDFEPHSLVINQSKTASLRVAVNDEVEILCVPQFINAATPLTVAGWVQL